jgi:hypothetical protein
MQQWALRFENDDPCMLFNKVYSALKGKGLPFPDENSARSKMKKSKPAPPKSMVDQSESNSLRPDRNMIKSPKPSSAKANSGSKNKKKKKPKVKKVRKKIELNEAQQLLKSEMDNIAENVILTNSMIDAAEPGGEDLDLIYSLVDTLKTTEPQIVETITNVDQSDLVDYAIKVNDDVQKTIRRFKKLQKGDQPGHFSPTHRNNNFTNPPEEEVKLEMSEDGVSDIQSIASS